MVWALTAGDGIFKKSMEYWQLLDNYLWYDFKETMDD